MGYSPNIDKPGEFAIALVPAGQYVWFCKITDEGKDRYGRSLALKVDATLFEQGDQELKRDIAQRTDSHYTFDTNLNDIVFLNNGNLITRFQSYTTHSGDVKQREHEQNREKVPQDRNRGVSSGNAKKPSDGTMPGTTKRTKKSFGKVAVFSVILVALAGISGTIIFRLQSDLEVARKEKQTLQGKLDEAEKTIDDKKEKISEIEGKLQRKKEETTRLNKELDAKQKDVLRLKEELDAAQEDASQQLRAENKKLRSRNEKLERMKEKFEALKSKLNQFMEEYISILQKSEINKNEKR